MTKHQIAAILWMAVALTIASPLWFESDVQEYSSEFSEHSGDVAYPHWRRYGGWFRYIKAHPPWPEYNLPAEREFIPIGFFLDVLLWSLIVFIAWLGVRLGGRRRQLIAQTEVEDNNG